MFGSNFFLSRPDLLCAFTKDVSGIRDSPDETVCVTQCEVLAENAFAVLIIIG